VKGRLTFLAVCVMVLLPITAHALDGTSFLGLLQHIDIEGKMTQLNIF
jgi:hypothetical protein